MAHIIKANLSILHSILQMIPQESYSLEDEKYLNASVFYFLQFLIQIFVFLTAIEYAIVILERKLAIQHFKKTNENDYSTGKRVILYSVSSFFRLRSALVSVGSYYFGHFYQSSIYYVFLFGHSPTRTNRKRDYGWTITRISHFSAYLCDCCSQLRDNCESKISCATCGHDERIFLQFY